MAPIYTTSLGVYSRFFTLGIPGVTSRTEWFGVNYWGIFGVDRSGQYQFDLLSDDGAKVYVDSKLIVSDDTLHPAQGSRARSSSLPAHTTFECRTSRDLGRRWRWFCW
ncbi:MAG TPA: PA14 domain-containing protein [Candidatus Sulfotelmatobacter sp.]